MAEWFQVTLRCHPSQREAAWAILYRFDCVGLEEIDSESCRAYFPSEVNRARILAALRASPSVDHTEEAIIPAENWHARWLESCQSFRVGPFFIRPSWREEPPEKGAVEIVMDPKGAFGTGSHATTQLCLKILPRLVDAKHSMADIGCGSGILSIAARKVSSSPMKLVALDNDPEAVVVCRDSAALNNVAFDIVCGTFAATRHAVDLIVANLQLNALVQSARDFYERTGPAANLLLSGILDEQVPEIRRAYEPAFELQSLCRQDEWVALVYRRT